MAKKKTGRPPSNPNRDKIWQHLRLAGLHEGDAYGVLLAIEDVGLADWKPLPRDVPRRKVAKSIMADTMRRARKVALKQLWEALVRANEMGANFTTVERRKMRIRGSFTELVEYVGLE